MTKEVQWNLFYGEGSSDFFFSGDTQFFPSVKLNEVYKQQTIYSPKMV